MNNYRANSPLLRTERLTKLYTDGQVNALRDVSVEIHRGEYVSIMGPSGSGKSTLLNLLGALDAPTSGDVYIDGQAISTCRNLDRLRARNVGFVFQSFYLLPVLTAIENVQVPMFEGQRLPSATRVRKASELLEIVGLKHRLHHLPQQLSVGERQRVAIARSLANDPLLLLADEPTGNLDSVSAAGVFDLFAELHRERNMTIVLVTHDDSLGHRAHRILRMQDGRLKADVDNRPQATASANGNGSANGRPVAEAPTAPKPIETPALAGVRTHSRPKSVLPPFAV